MRLELQVGASFCAAPRRGTLYDNLAAADATRKCFDLGSTVVLNRGF